MTRATPKVPQPRKPTHRYTRKSPGRQVLFDHSSRRPLYNKLLEAPESEAWLTYQRLLKSRLVHAKHLIPQKYLHGFAARLVSQSKWVPPQRTRTQTTFHRLLSIIKSIWYSGGQVRLWEWNALIECAGRGWRKTRVDDFSASMSIYQDMLANRTPGSVFSRDGSAVLRDHSKIASQPVKPDIVTYTTLLTIAARTQNSHILQEAESMLIASKLPPNYFTHMVHVRYYARTGRLSGLRATLGIMKVNGIRLGIDGVNACMWAYAQNRRLDVAAMMYRILRHGLLSQNGCTDINGTPIEDVNEDIRELDAREGITIPSGLTPDAITYYSLIQAYAYHGHLQPCLHVFRDMVASPVAVTGLLEDVDGPLDAPTVPHPVLPIFRALFLGFARHAVPPSNPHTGIAGAVTARAPATPHSWTLAQLDELFTDFVALSGAARPNARTVYWLLVAFAITSGHDRAVLRGAWARLAARYGVHWDGRVERLRAQIHAPEFDRAYFEGLRARRDERWERWKD